jgi:hypothetical protein
VIIGPVHHYTDHFSYAIDGEANRALDQSRQEGRAWYAEAEAILRCSRATGRWCGA